MSIGEIRGVLVTKLQTIVPAIDTAYERTKFIPQTGMPFQNINLLFADVENPAMGNGMYRESGIFQITLQYPLGKGSYLIEERAELLKSTFYRGLTLETSSGIKVIIDRTPSVQQQPEEKDRAIIIVKIPFFAEVFN